MKTSFKSLLVLYFLGVLEGSSLSLFSFSVPTLKKRGSSNYAAGVAERSKFNHSFIHLMDNLF